MSCELRPGLRRRLGRSIGLGRLLCAGLLGVATAASAIVPNENPQHAPKLRRFFSAPELRVNPEQTADMQRAVGRSQKPALSAFLSQHHGEWKVTWDRRNDRPNLIEGSGIALVPGRGNSLSMASLGFAPNEAIDMAVVEALLLGFIADNADLLNVRGMEFRIDPNGSVPVGKDKTHWFIEFAQYKNGVRVKDANLFFRVSHGNIVQFGTLLIAPVGIDTVPTSTRENAFDLAWRELDPQPGIKVREIVEPGELLVLPYAADNARPGTRYSGADGKGYAHRLAWRFVFRIDDDITTYEVLVDAKTNRVIETRDLNAFVAATVDGGIFEGLNTGPEVIRPMPFASVSNGIAKITDMLGIYDYSGGTATVTLDGQFFKISDRCGQISLSNANDGNLHLGTSPGTDCSVSGIGGAGNTRASRNAFYYLTRINRKAINFLPGNAWLSSKVTANINIDNVCNASWDGISVNFYKHGRDPNRPQLWCANTGELPGVFLHEWGHGMDTNSGGQASEKASSEAVGDTFAFLESKDSCIGNGFYSAPDGGGPIDNHCYNCENNCTGVRDVGAVSTLGGFTVARPSTVTDNNGINCDRFLNANGSVNCPYLRPDNRQSYAGPMGYQGHCESLIASSANWDLAQRLVSTHGAAQGWAAMDRIWYASLTPSKSAYQVTAGGQCNANAAVDGCGATNWYTVYLAADDDDGNLANGTPNACRIWDAFNDHGIACGERPRCTEDGDPGFTLRAAPNSTAVCSGNPARFTINVANTRNYIGTVTLTATGNPAGSTTNFNPGSVNAFPGSSTFTLGTAGVAAGSYPITINGTGTGAPVPLAQSASVTVNVVASNPATASLTAPANAATDVTTAPTLTWSAVNDATSYTLEIASDAGFSTLLKSVPNLTTPTTSVTGLPANTTVYWRVTSHNECGTATSAVSRFTTSNFVAPICSTANATIPASNAITITDPSQLTGLKVQIKSTYNWVGDLKVTLSNGTDTAVLINYPGVVDGGPLFGCGSRNIDVTLDDASTTPVDSQCNKVSPAISGVAKPSSPINPVFANRPFAGTYTLSVTQANVSVGDGTLDSWCLVPTLAAVTPTTYTVTPSVSGGNGSISPTTPQSVNSGATTAFTLTPNARYRVVTPVGGSCARGSLNGNTYTTGAITQNCTVTASFRRIRARVGGTVTGLLGNSVTLALNGTVQTVRVSANGAFQFPDEMDSDSSYAVTVQTQPTNPALTCRISRGSGTFVADDVDDVQVVCDDTLFKSGLEQ